MISETIQEKLGQEVRRRRESLGLTLGDLAERSGLTQNYIGGIELGKRDPSLSSIHRLAWGLGIEPSELFGTLPNVSPAATEAGQLFDRAAAEVQESVLILLSSFIKKLKGQKIQR